MIIDCISDLHGFFPKLEGGDLLIVAGDLTARDTKDELLNFHSFVTKQKYRKTIIIAGNHDNSCVKEYPFYNRPFAVDGMVMPHNEIEYLCDSGTEFEGLKIWGSPWTKTFPGMNRACKDFTCDTEKELDEKWKWIPDEIDILITHGPAHGILDGIIMEDGTDSHAGSTSLAREIYSRIRPSLLVFGHIHEQGGQVILLDFENKKKMRCINCSYVNENYKPVNKPVRVIL